MSKKYFWLKLKEDFFRDKWIKKLRRVAGGDTYTVIYLKMQLLSLKNEGLLVREDLNLDFHQELALEIDEDEDNVLFTLMFLQNNGLIEEVLDGEFMLKQTVHSIGSEVDSAERVRKFREKKKQLALQCNEQVTIGNTEKEKEKEKEKYKDSDLHLDSEQKEQKKEVQQIELLEEYEEVEKPKEKKISKLERQCKEIQERYNSHEVLYKKRRSVGMSPKRIKLLKKFIENYTFEEVINAMDNAAKVNDWMLNQPFFDFNWIFKEEENFEAVLNGKYIDNYNTNSQSTSTDYQPVSIDNIFGE